MPVGRGAGATVVHNGKIYYAGGLHGGVAVSLFDVYDPTTNSWSSLPNMPRVREHFHGAVVNGKLWAIGGRSVAINATISQTDAFNFSSGQWETGFAPIPTMRGGFGVGVAGDEVIVFGGEGGGISHPEVEAYNTSTNQWRQLAPMAVPRHGMQVAECNGAYYLATGSTDQGGGSASAYNDVFRLSSGTGCGSGGGGGTTPIGFGVSSLSGTSGSNPTTLAWGPDGRLYVGYMFGAIRAFTVVRDGANSYRVTSTETINTIANLPNRNDNGQLNSAVTGRLLLGIAVTGTASNPVIYATSSDPRIGGGAEGTDLNLDTNSGTLSRLSWTGSSWQHTLLVQGLPRSEENHGPNGIALSSNGQTLYWAYGGHTNKGGPSNNFANLPEYAYSAAILSVDLAAIGNSTYTVPTLDDPSRGSASGPNQNDVNDPFGGNDGANQARITAGSPVQVFAPGFRNPYDLLIATTGNHAGKIYTPDNGPNGGWGDVPVGEGTQNCTNQTVAQAETGANDALHLVTPGYYGGHANPTRGNANNTFNGQSPVLSSNPVECDFRSSKTSETTSLSLLPNSSNGIAEYTTNNFGGAMTGNLVIASYQARKIVRIALNSTGAAVTLREDNFATFNEPSRPLDVVTMGSTQAFPGTIWIADITADTIHVMEPNDFGGGGGGGCTGQDSTALDEDGDGYSNADEIDNGTNPCSAASKPPDHDGDGVSDLNDPNDDNDGLADLSDAFAIDPTNGTATGLPVVISWENDEPPPGGIANTGFTGLMTNGTTNYLNQFDENGMVVGGAAGVFTVTQVPAGDAGGAKNSQMYGFQLGVDPPTTKFQIVGRIVEPFSGITPGSSQQMGVFLGDGTQDSFVKLVLKGNDTSVEDVHLAHENLGTSVVKRNRDIVLPGPDFVDLRLVVDPTTATAQGFAQASIGGVLQPQITMGNPIPIPSSWLTSTTRGLAAGLISTSVGAAPPFPATWDFFHVEPV
jgi:Kelch motif/Galactose oxidase, central domain